MDHQRGKCSSFIVEKAIPNNHYVVPATDTTQFLQSMRVQLFTPSTLIPKAETALHDGNLTMTSSSIILFFTRDNGTLSTNNLFSTVILLNPFYAGDVEWQWDLTHSLMRHVFFQAPYQNAARKFFVKLTVYMTKQDTSPRSNPISEHHNHIFHYPPLWKFWFASKRRADMHGW